MCEEWRLFLDKGESVGSIAMDLSRAFDSVSHGLLITKFHAYGASATACKLLECYQSNCFQRVKLNGDKSEWLSMTRGFPQGSILGPLQFNIVFNDIFYFSEKCNLYNYADDNVCSVAGSDVSWAQIILKICSKWTWILVIWETIRNLSNHVLKPRFMGSAQSDITESTYGICCPFNIKTAWMFMISENYCLRSMDRIAHVLFACKQVDEIL